MTPPEVRPQQPQTVLHTFTTEISPHGQIFVGGSGGDRLPEPPRLEPWVKLAAWIDQRNNPAVVGLYPPNNMTGPDVVTVEVIEGDFAGHASIGAETVLVGEMTFFDPMLAVWAATGKTVRVPFEVQQDATYEVWVEVAGRQEAIAAHERWDSEQELPLPANERWWVTLKFSEGADDA